MFDRVMFLSNF